MTIPFFGNCAEGAKPSLKDLSFKLSLPDKRIIVVTGHYGSGKTEFSVSLALQMREHRLALIDLDIINPYFRSRERRDILEQAGISVYGSAYKTEVTAELPALGADIRAPLEDKNCRVIVDAGGNDAGAIVLNQFAKYFMPEDTAVLAVINANRPDTRDVPGAISHIRAIEAATGLTVTGLVSNCHLLRETTAETVIKGHELCVRVSGETGIPLLCDCYPEGIVDPEDLPYDNLMPLGLYLRPTWQDR